MTCEKKPTELIVKRKNVRQLEHEYGYEPCYEERSFQYLCERTTKRFLGITFTTDNILDHEEIPGHVITEIRIFGGTEWRSKFATSGARFLQKEHTAS